MESHIRQYQYMRFTVVEWFANNREHKILIIVIINDTVYMHTLNCIIIFLTVGSSDLVLNSSKLGVLCNCAFVFIELSDMQ